MHTPTIWANSQINERQALGADIFGYKCQLKHSISVKSSLQLNLRKTSNLHLNWNHFETGLSRKCLSICWLGVWKLFITNNKPKLKITNQ